MDAKQQRSIKINVAAVKRLGKEKLTYATELADVQAKLAALPFALDSPEQPHMEAFKAEAETTLHDVQRRLKDFKGKLRAALGDLGDQYPDDPLVIEAKALLA
jgi:hypothetical protein